MKLSTVTLIMIIVMCTWQPVRSIAVEREELRLGRVEGATQREDIRKCEDVSFRRSVYGRDAKRWNVIDSSAEFVLKT